MHRAGSSLNPPPSTWVYTQEVRALCSQSSEEAGDWVSDGGLGLLQPVPSPVHGWGQSPPRAMSMAANIVRLGHARAWQQGRLQLLGNVVGVTSTAKHPVTFLCLECNLSLEALLENLNLVSISCL